MTGRATSVAQPSSVITWKRAKADSPSEPKRSGLLSEKNFVAMTAET